MNHQTSVKALRLVIAQAIGMLNDPKPDTGNFIPEAYTNQLNKVVGKLELTKLLINDLATDYGADDIHNMHIDPEAKDKMIMALLELAGKVTEDITMDAQNDDRLNVIFNTLSSALEVVMNLHTYRMGIRDSQDPDED